MTWLSKSQDKGRWDQYYTGKLCKSSKEWQKMKRKDNTVPNDLNLEGQIITKQLYHNKPNGSIAREWRTIGVKTAVWETQVLLVKWGSAANVYCQQRKCLHVFTRSFVLSVWPPYVCINADKLGCDCCVRWFDVYGLVGPFLNNNNNNTDLIITANLPSYCWQQA